MTRIRPCGMSWSYCDGKCEKCQTMATDNTSIVTTPTNYCDRNLCATMEANGKDCEDCPANGGEVTE